MNGKNNWLLMRSQEQVRAGIRLRAGLPDASMSANGLLAGLVAIKESLLSNPQVVENLLKFVPRTLASIRMRCPTEAQVLK